ncbi:MAG: VCBS domain-containing protein, partial [Rubripirellula sp.]
LAGNGGAGATNGHDQLIVDGVVTLGGASLSLVASPLPARSSYKIIDNQSSSPVSGLFGGMGEGSTISVGGLNLVLTYKGGDAINGLGEGNDVVLFDPSLLEFDDTTTSELEGADAATAAGPTLVVKGDLSDLSDAQRTVTFSLTNLETTSDDVNSGPLSYTIPADNYAGGTDPDSRLNLIEKGVVVIQSDNLLEGNENFDLDINTYGSLIGGQADPTDSLNPGTIHDILDDESADISIAATMVDETGVAQAIDVTLTITGVKSVSYGDFEVASEVDLDAQVVQGASGTAVDPDDYSYATQDVNFGPGTVTGSVDATVTVDITPEIDALVEGNEKTNLTVTNLTDGRNTGDDDLNGTVGLNGGANSGMITIADANSSSWAIQQSIGATTATGAAAGVAEFDEGETATYTITYHTVNLLASGLTSEVTIGFTSVSATDGVDLDASVAAAIEAAVIAQEGSNTPGVDGTFHFNSGTGVLTFTGDDVTMSPTLVFNLSAVEDSLAGEGDESYTIALTSAAGTVLPNVVLDPQANTTAEDVDAASVTTIIDDNDAPVANDVDLGTTDEETPFSGILDNDASDGLVLGAIGGQTTGTFASDADDELDLADATIVSVAYSLDGGTSFTTFADLNAAGVDLNTTTGEITFDPTTIAEYQALADGESALVEIEFNITDSQLETSNDATITFTVAGVNDNPIIVTEELAGSVTEDGDIADVTTGLITFTDADLTDEHTADAEFTSTDHPDAAAFGVLTAVVDTDTTGTGLGGEVNWDYTVDNAAIQFLADGETVTETHTITLDDD